MCPMKGKNHVSTGIGVQTMQKGYLCELKLIIAGPPRLLFIIVRELEGRMYFGKPGNSCPVDQYRSFEDKRDLVEMQLVCFSF